MTPSPPPLDAGRIQVWWSTVPPPETDLGALSELLDDGERGRADRFRVEPPRRAHIVAHAMLRTILAGHCAASPKELRFGELEHGKPYLKHPASDLHFNLSHSGTTVTLAVCRGSELGIDVEELRDRANAEGLARRFFSATESAHVSACRGAVRQRSFFHLWTVKEAYLKALGTGITAPLDQVEADPDPERPLRLLNLGGSAAEAAAWSLLRPRLHPGAVCTVAIRGRGWELETREWGLP